MRLGSTALATERVERRLAAILAADVAGYSRLMGADEEGTLARLKAHRREMIDPKIKEHKGRIVKTTGDGILVEFASAWRFPFSRTGAFRNRLPRRELPVMSKSFRRSASRYRYSLTPHQTGPSRPTSVWPA
jgi:class 3 adenylate cyclase